MTRTIVEITPGPSLPTTFSAQIAQPTQPAPSVMPPVALVEIATAAELIPGPIGPQGPVGPAGSPDTGADILVKLAPVDGAGSGLDADLLDGQNGTYYLDRANHTGTQAIATVSGLQPALDAKVDDSEYTAADVMAKVQTLDGAGSGLDADLLDGQSGAYYTTLANQTGTLSDAQHGNRGGGALHSVATPSVAGFMVDAPNDGTQYVRKNVAWAPVSVPPGTAISDTPPGSPQPGQMWWESDSGNLYIYFNDGTSSQWVQVTGPGVQSPLLTSWMAYTPTFTGLGTPTSVAFFSRRVGGCLQIRGRFASGTPTGVETRITFGYNGVNGGVVGDPTQLPAQCLVGNAIQSTVGANIYYPLAEPSLGYLTFGAQNSARSALAKLIGTDFTGAGITWNVVAEVPISGW